MRGQNVRINISEEKGRKDKFYTENVSCQPPFHPFFPY